MGRRQSKSIGSTAKPIGSPAKKPSAPVPSNARYAAMFMELEQRIAFDGAAAETVEKTQQAAHETAGAEATPHAGPSEHHDIQALAAALQRAHPAIDARPVAEHHPTEIVFVDTSVEGYDKLLAGISSDFQVVLLDASKDGVTQIAAALSGRHDIDAIHIISHGNAGSLTLGTSSLDSLSMAGEYASALKQIGESLSKDADILVYGCNFGEGARGALASEMLGRLTGADIAASTNLTGSADHGGDWVLERETGRIESHIAIDAATRASFDATLNATAGVGKGAFIVVEGRTFYSVDATTGKATAIATAPGTINNVDLSNTLNSLGADQANGLIYFTDNNGDNANRALFAYDYVNNSFILIDSDLTDNGAGLSLSVGSTGVGGGAAAFANNALFMGVENVSGSDDQIYRVTFSNNGRSIASIATFGSLVSGTNDWGDFAVDQANNVLLSISGTTGATITRYNLATGAIINTITGNTSTIQGGGDLLGNTYLVGTSLQQIDPVTGALIGSAIAITTNGTTAIALPSDATSYTPTTGTIGDKVFDDNNKDGVFNTGDTGLSGVTVQLVDDVNNNGVVDAGERILATDTTDLSGNYLFTGVLPGAYIVRITDAGGVLGSATATTATAKTVSISRIGGTDLSADFGYDVRPPLIDLDGGTPTTIALTGSSGSNDVVSGGTFSGASPNVFLVGSADNSFSWSFSVASPLDAPGTRAVLNLTTIERSFKVTVNGTSIHSSTDFQLVGSSLATGEVLLRFADGTEITSAQLVNSNNLPRVQVILTPQGIEFWGTRTTTSTVLERMVPASGTVTLPAFVQGSNTIGLVNTGGNYASSVAGTLTVTAPDFDYATSYTENGTGVSIGGTGLSVYDPDSTTMAWAMVTLTNAQAGDLLSVAGTLPAGISASLDTSVAGKISLTLSGTAARSAYETAIKQVQFLSTSDAPSTVSRFVNVNIDDGGLISNTATTTITVTAVNDAPVNTLPAFTTPEDVSKPLTGLSIADPDAGSGTMTVTLNVGSGKLTAASGAGVTVSNSGTATVTLSGTLANINAYLASASAPVYVPVANASGSVTLTMTTSDNGNTGTGGTLSDVDTSTITVTAVNDAPVNTLPAGYSGTEDTSLALTGLSISDVDAGSGTMSVTLSVASGVVTAASGSGVTVSGSGTGSLVLTGTLSNINSYLASAAAPLYVPAADVNGAVTLTMTTNDGGNTGAGGAMSDVDTTTITLAAVNDAPVIDLDTSASGTGYSTSYVENGTGVAVVNGNMSLADVDNANMASATIVLTNAQAGDLLAVSGALPSGITSSYNSSTSTLTLSGSATKAAYATALGQVRYLSSSENPSTTPRTINVSVNDGALSSNVAVTTVSVTAVNDAPVNTLPASFSGNEDTSVALTGLQISDADALSGSMSVTLSVNSGTLTATAGGNVAVSGSGSGQIVLTGTMANINAYLASSASAPTYTPVADYNGAVTLTMATNDNGNTGTGTPLTDTDTSTITIAAVADIAADTASTNEDSSVVIAVLSNDSFANPGRTITAINGMAIASGGTVSFASGTVQLNSNGTLTFSPAANYNGSAVFSYTVTSGGVTETANVTVTVAAVNDAPVNTTPSAYSTNEDTSLALTGLAISDVDAGSGTMTVTLNVGSGTLTAASGAGVTVSNSGTATVTLSGTLANINAYLASASAPVYVPVANASGSVTLTMTTSDNGNTGTGGTLSDVDTSTITVTAVNDAPVNTLPAGYSGTEDTSLALTGLSISDVDAGSGTMSVTLSVASGVVTAASGSGVTVSGSGTGSLVLTGTLSNINSYLASAAAPLYVPAADVNGAVTLTMTTNDGGNTGAGGAMSDVDTTTITLAAVNDAPVIDLDTSASGTGYSTSYVENGTGVAVVNGNMSLADVDNANMASATIVLTNAQAGDLLAVSGALPSGITSSYNSSTSTLTLSGSATKAAYATALGQVRYLSSSENPSTTPRTINVSVNDGALSSNVAVTTVSVTAVNDAPVNTLPASFSGNEDTSVALTGLQISDADALSGSMSVTLSVNSGTLTATAGGNVAVSGSGSGQIVLTGTLSDINSYLSGTSRPVYVPVADYNGATTITMITRDGGNTGTGGVMSDTDTSTITIAAVADIAGDTATTNEDTAVTIAVLGNDSFANPGRTITAINGTAIASGGTVTLATGTVQLNSNGTLTFTPAANYNGQASFTYTVTSGGVTETAGVDVTINPVDDAPVNSFPAAQTMAEDAVLVFSSGNGNAVTVSDVDGGNQTVTLTSSNGTLTLATLAGLSFSAGDGTNDATMTFTGTLAAINAALNGLSYTPVADYNGAAQITLQDSGQAVADTINVTINPVADIVADSVSTNEDTAISFNAITGPSGADNFENPGRAVTAVTQPPAGQGTVSFAADGTLTYTPAANYNGTTSFTYTVTSGGVDETATVTVTVIPVNDAPIAVVPGAQTIAEDTGRVFSAGNGNAITVSDADDGTLTVTVSSTQGVLTLSTLSGLSFSSGDGTADATMTFTGTTAAINAALSGLRYDPNPDYNGSAAITVLASDGQATDTQTVALTITPVADIAGDNTSTAANTAVVIDVLANDSFEDSGRTISAVNGTAITVGGPAVAVSNGTVALTSGAKLVFTPANAFSGNSSFTYTVTAGGVTETATVQVAVAGANRPPVNTLPGGFTTLEDQGLQLSGLSISDPDAGSGTMTVTLSVGAGTLAATTAGNVTVTNSGTSSLTLSGTVADINSFLAGAGRPVFTPLANATASVTLTMTTNDNGNSGGGALTDIDTSTITLIPVNDAPAGTAKTVTIDEDASYTFAAADFGFVDLADDPANSLLAVVITTLPQNGVLSLAGAPVTAGQVVSAGNLASLAFTPSANANGSALASFTFQVRDNGGTANGGVNTDPTPRTFTFNVTPVNDAPVNTLPPSFSMNEDAVLTLAGLSVADVDAGASGITVKLQVAQGVLSASTGGGVAVTGSGTGQLVLSGTVASINAFLAGGSAPRFTPSANFNGSVALTMTSDDGGSSGSGGAQTDRDQSVITVMPVNDAPVGANASISAMEDVAASGTLPVATDVDGDTLTYAAGATAPQHGSVTVNPDGTYTYVPAANFFGTDTFSYTVSDGTATVTYSASVTVSEVNDAPTAVNDSGSTGAGSATTQNVLANDSDADADPMTVVAVAGMSGGVGMAVPGSTGGTFTILADGSARFDPNGGFADLAAGATRTTSVTYSVADGRGGVGNATFTVTVTGVNDAPTASSIAAQTANDGAITSFDVSGTFSDPDVGDTLRYTATGLPAGLTINAATGVISGTINHSASVTGPYSVTVTATDAAGLSASSSFVWTVLNPAPIAANDDVSTTEAAASLSGSVLADNGRGADRDPDGDTITVSAVNGTAGSVGMAVAGSQGGVFTIAANGAYSFVSGSDFDNLAPGATRVTTVNYTISDGEGGFSTATVAVTVTGTNNAPTAGADSFSTSETAAVVIDVLANDRDVDGGTLAVTAINGTAIAVGGGSVAVTGGSVTLNSNGTLTFSPTGPYNATPSFTYTVSDGQGGTATGSVSGTVTSGESAPAAANDVIAATEDTPVSFDVRLNDTDADNDPLAVVAIDGQSIVAGSSVAISGGSIRLNANGTLTFTPNADFNGPAAFGYTVSDGRGGTSGANVTVNVAAVQDAPRLGADSFTTNEDTAATISVLANDSDPDGDPLTITAINGSAIAVGGSVATTGGVVTLNADGTLRFVPNADVNGPTSFTYTVSDGQGGSTTATVSGSIVAVNDAPVAMADSFVTNEDSPVVIDILANDRDVDGDSISVIQINGSSIVAGNTLTVTGGSVTLNADKTLTFTPTANFNGSVGFSYTIFDGKGGTATASVSGSVTPVNDAPVATADSFTTAEDTAFVLNPLANDSDVDGDMLQITAIDGHAIVAGATVSVSNGLVTLNADGSLTFRPDANYNGPISFGYTVSDGTASVSSTVTGTVTAVNDAPTGSDASITTAEDTAFNGTLPVATDVDSNTLTYTAGATGAASGTVTIASGGTYTYTPNANFNGIDSFSYIVSDGQGGSREYTVTVAVTPVNDAPTSSGLSDRTRVDGQAVSFSASQYFSDVDGDALTYTQTGMPLGLSISPSGLVSGTIDHSASHGGPNGDGVYTITITATDPSGAMATATYTTVVTNPAPVAVNDTVVTNEDAPVVFNVLDGTSSGGAADSDPDGDTIRLVSATAAHGTVTFAADGTMTYTPNANFNGKDTISYTISDGDGGTATAMVSVNVVATNDQPTASSIADRTRSDGQVEQLAAAAFFSDVDGDTLTFTASGLPLGLMINQQTGVISGTIDPGASGPTGRQVYAITITARDGSTNSDGSPSQASATFNYTVVNIPPSAGNDTATTAEDTPVDIAVLANDTDADGDVDQVVRVNNVVLSVGGPAVATANGMVALVLDGTGHEVLRFTPKLNFNGVESFDYTISDPNGGEGSASVSVTVTPVNDAPTITAQAPAGTATDGQVIDSDASSLFSDVDGDTLTFSASHLPLGLSISASGRITGTIDANASQVNGGVYQVVITATDPSGAFATQSYQLTVANLAPTAASDTVTTNEDTPVAVNVIANDVDPDGDPLTVVAASAGHGTVSFNAGVITYTPTANYNGSDTILYTISDGNGGTASSSVAVTVTAVNDAPTAQPIANMTDSSGETIRFESSAYFTDVDADTLTYQATGLPPGLSIDQNTGRISGVLSNTGVAGSPYSVAITANDGHVGTTQSFTWSIVITPAKAVNDVSSTGENQSFSGNVLTNDSTANSPTVTSVNGVAGNVGVAVTGSEGGSFVIRADGSYDFIPGTAFDSLKQGESRTTTVTYELTEFGGGRDTATVIVTVNGANDAPIAGTIPNYTGVDNQSVTANPVDISAFFSDVDRDSLSYAATGLPAGLTIDATGKITGTIARNASQGGSANDGVYHVTVTATDPSGAVATASYTYAISNPPPSAVNDTATTAEDTPLTLNVIDGSASGNVSDSDPDGDAISVVSASAANGTVVLGSGGSLTYTPNADYNGPDTITYRISDGQGGFATGTVAVTVTAVNDAPAATPIPSFVRNDGAAVSFNVSGAFSDVDGDTLTYAVSGLPVGLVFDTTTGIVSGTIVAGASGPTGSKDYTVQFTASDGHGGSRTFSTTLTVTNVAPVAVIDSRNAVEDTPIDIDVLSNDSDPDGDQIVVATVNETAISLGGSAVATANGSVRLVSVTVNGMPHSVLRYTPNANFHGMDSFTYSIVDDNGGTAATSVSIDVAAANDAPTATTIPARSGLDGVAVSFDLSNAFSDVDGDTLTYSAIGLPAGLTINSGTGVVSGTIGAGASQVNGGVYTVTVTASDATSSTPTSFTYTIGNPAPTAVNDTVTTAEDTPVTFDPVTATNTGNGGVDVDPDGDALTIVAINGVSIGNGGSVSLAQGTLTLSGSSTLTFTPYANVNGPQSFTYQISDGQGGFADAVVTINITPVADAPTLDLNGAGSGVDNADTFTEGGAPVRLTSGTATVFDSEGDIVALRVTISGGGLDGSSEVIRLNGSVALVSGTAASGTIVFGGTSFAFSYDGAGDLAIQNASGAGTPLPSADLKALIDAIRYENVSDNPTAGVRSFAFVATDSTGLSSPTATSRISVAAVNDAPIAAADTRAVDEHTVLTVAAPGVLGNDSDPDGDALTVTAVGGASVGTAVAGSARGLFVINADGSYSFDPNNEFEDLKAGQTRTTSVSYTVSDGHGGTAFATLSVTVTGLNDAPVGADLTVSTQEDQILTGTLPVATDFDGDTLTYAVATVPAHGTVSISADGNYTYAPSANYNGTDSFTYSVNDGTVAVVYTVSLTVTAVNDAPAGPAALPNLSLQDSASTSVPLAGYFTDADGDALVYTATNLPTGLTLNATTGVLSGTVDHSASQVNGGVYTVAIRATDPSGAFTSASFSINVVNPAPIAFDDRLATTQSANISGSVFSDNGNGADTDPDGDTLVVATVGGSAMQVGAAVAGSAGGTFTVNADGTYSFAPGSDFVGLGAGASRATSISYAISDGQGGMATAILTVTVAGQDDAPVGTSTSFVTNEDTVYAGTLPMASDADGDAIVYGIGSSPAHGNLQVRPDGTFTYTPTANYNGPDSFTYTISSGGVTVPYTVSVGVTSVNDLPVAGADSFTVSEDGSVVVSVLGNDSDADNDTLTVTAINGQSISVGSPVALANGTVSLNADKTLTFAPGANYNGPISFNYTVSDGNGGTAMATVSGSVTAVNDIPVAQNDAYSTGENQTVSGNVLIDAAGRDTDADGDTLTVVGVSTVNGGVGTAIAGSAGGRFTVSADGSFVFDPGTDFDGLKAGQTATTNVAYTISDGQGGTATATLTVTVNGANDAPTAPSLPTRSNADGAVVASFAIDTGFSDPDGDALTFTVSGLPTGLVFDPATRTVSGTIAHDASGSTGSRTFAVDVTASDGTTSVTRSFAWTVTNPVPTAQNDAITTAEDTAVSGNVLIDNGAGADTDPDGDPLAVSLVTGPQHGTLTLAANGAYTYTPSANFNGVDTFVYSISDGNGGTSSATATITVTAVNDAPVAGNDSFTVAENGSTVIAVLANDSDADQGDTLSVKEINGVAVVAGQLVAVTGGSVTLNADGTLSFTATPHYNGPAAFSYTVSDATVSASGSVSGAVTAVNDAPVNTLPASFGTNEDTPLQLTGLGVVDIDAGSASITVTLDVGGGTLAAANGGGVLVGGSGTAHLTLTGTVSDINGFLAGAGAPVFSPAANSSAPVTLTMTTNDGGNTGAGGPLSATTTSQIIVAAVNDAPTAADVTLSARAQTPVSGAIVGQDVDGDALTYSLVAQPAEGTVRLNPDGTFTFKSLPNVDGIVRFDIQVDDGNGGIKIAHVQVNVTSVDNAPVGSNVTVATNEDTVLAGTLPAAVDVENDPLTYALNTNAANGTAVVLANGRYTYTPNANFNGTDSFTYTVSDGTTAVVYTVRVNVAAVNDAPVAVADSFTVAEDQPVTFDVVANDTDVEGDVLSVTAINGIAISVGSPVTVRQGSVTQGTVTLNGDGTLTFMPAADFNGAFSFTYTAADPAGATATGSVNGTVTPVNDAPVVTSPTDIAATEDTPLTGRIVANDVDGDPLTFTLATAPAHGTIVLNADGTYTYTPAADYNGGDSFSVAVSDGHGGSATQAFTISVAAVADAPVTGADSFVVAEDGAATIDVLGNDRAPDGGPLTVSAVNGRPIAVGAPVRIAAGTVSLNPDGTLSFVPDANYNGPANFSYTARNAEGLTTTGSVSGQVTAVNDAPVLTPQTIDAVAGKTATGSLGAVDPDGDELVYTVTQPPLHGTLTIAPNGSYRYVPAPGYIGPDSFGYSVSDGTVTVSGTASIAVAESPPPDVQIDPRVQGPDMSSVTASSPRPVRILNVDGEVIKALDGLGSIDAGPINVRVVDTAVDAMSDLNGISDMPTDQIITRTVRADMEWREYGRLVDDFTVEPFLGGSDIGQLLLQRDGTSFAIDTTINEGFLYVMVAASEVSDGVRVGREPRVTLADGRALPGWLSAQAGGLVVGHPPAGLESIALKVQAVNDDGTIATDVITINVRTGEIAREAPAKTAAATPSMFSDQLRAELSMSDDGASDLAAALRP